MLLKCSVNIHKWLPVTLLLTTLELGGLFPFRKRSLPCETVDAIRAIGNQSQLQAHLHVNKKLDLILSPPQIRTEVNSIVACFKALFLFRMYTPAPPFISPRKTLYEVL